MSWLRGGAAGFGLLDGRLWCHGVDTLRGDFLLLGRNSFFLGEWEWSQCPEDDCPGSRGRPEFRSVAESGGVSSIGKAFVDALCLLLLKQKLVLVVIKGDGQGSCQC